MFKAICMPENRVEERGVFGGVAPAGNTATEGQDDPSCIFS
jgi:hypothetical protein